jgi:hypothetical protein
MIRFNFYYYWTHFLFEIEKNTNATEAAS